MLKGILHLNDEHQRHLNRDFKFKKKWNKHGKESQRVTQWKEISELLNSKFSQLEILNLLGETFGCSYSSASEQKYFCYWRKEKGFLNCNIYFFSSKEMVP